jgi:hypothetical protein
VVMLRHLGRISCSGAGAQIGMDAAMLFAQQLQRHARPTQIAVDCRPVRLWPPILRGDRGGGYRNHSSAAHVLGQRPTQAGPPRPCMQSPAAVGPIDKLAAIWRSGMPPARSLSTSHLAHR